MDEETKVEGSAPSVEETNTASLAEVEQSTETTQEVETEKAPDQEPAQEQPKESDSQKESKGTRSQRRIQTLLGKLKEKEAPPKTDVFGQNLPPWWQTQSQTENDGELTIEQLNQKMMTVAQLAVAQERQRNEFLNKVNGHNTELEDIAKLPEFGNKDFDERYTKLYQQMNYDESGQFKPKASPREIFDILKGVASMGETKGSQETSVKMAQTIANSAVTPTSARAESPDRKKRELFAEARDSGSTDKWAEYLKTII